MNPSPVPSSEAGQLSAQFPLVGIGASAGGLAALQQLLPALPANAGVAVVIILHLTPDQPSTYDQVLRKYCAMPVTQVTEHPTALRPDHVYVIAPGTLLKLEDNFLFLDEATVDRTPLGTIDYFFHSLSLSHRRLAIGVLLSGMGSDGVAGLAAIRQQGGTTVAQEPQDAQHASMPQAAIDSGQADIVLPAAEIGPRLLLLRDGITSGTLDDAARDGEYAALLQVLQLLRDRTGHDFHHYKRQLILRRLERRMHFLGARNVAAYRELLERDGEEAGRLLKDLLIGVTGFFRDRAAFDKLRDLVLPALFDAATQAGELRAWVAGCSTGQEAYSLAIMLAEHARSVGQSVRVHIFATDIDEQALGVARAGLYPASIADEVPDDILRRYFVPVGAQYRVRQSLRAQITFASHDVLRDPPFSGLDLVTCRNLLIYIARDMQWTVLQRFHFALDGAGYLFLGSAESADVANELFKPVDLPNRLYAALPSPRSYAAVARRLAAGRALRTRHAGASRAVARPQDAEDSSTQDELLSRLANAESQCELLQSSNEELSTINAELKFRADDTGKANDDLNNLISSVDVATVFVDPELVVMRFTPRAEGIFNLLPRDVGRHLLDITHRLDYPQLADDVRRAFESRQPAEREVDSNDGRHFIARIQPYMTSEHDASGAVLTFFDITLRRAAEQTAHAAVHDKAFLLALGDCLRPLSDPGRVLELGCRMLGQRLGVEHLAYAAIDGGRYALLPGFAADGEQLRGEGEVEALGQAVLGAWRAGHALVDPDVALGPSAGSRLALLAAERGALLATPCRKGGHWLGFFIARQAGPRQWSELELLLFKDGAQRIGVEHERARAQRALHASESRMRTLLRGFANASWEADANGMLLVDSPSWRAYTGQTVDQWLGEGWFNAVHPDDRAEVQRAWREAVRNGKDIDARFRQQGPAGRWRWTNLLATPLLNADGSIQKWVGINIDDEDEPAQLGSLG